MSITPAMLDDKQLTTAGQTGVPSEPATNPVAVMRRGVWGMADQGVVSLGSFLTNIILARSLHVLEYGSYALILGVMLFLNNLHASLITYPLSITGAAASVSSLKTLTSGSLLLSMICAPVQWIGVVLIAHLTHHVSAIPIFALALLMWQLQETLRRALMANMRFRDAIWGDSVSYLGQAAVLYLLMRSGRPSLTGVFLVSASTSAAALIIQAAQIGMRRVSFRELRDLGKSFFGLGRWVAMSNLTGILNIQAVPWTLAAFHGIGESAKLAATGTVLGVTHPALFGINNLILPATARARSAGWKAVRRAVAGYLVLGLMLTLPYYLVVAARPGFALRFFYGAKSEYQGLHVALTLFAVVYLLSFFSNVTGAILNGLGRSRTVFISQLVGAGATLVVSVPLAAIGNVKWALCGGLVSVALQILINAIALKRISINFPPQVSLLREEFVAEPDEFASDLTGVPCIAH